MSEHVLSTRIILLKIFYPSPILSIFCCSKFPSIASVLYYEQCLSFHISKLVHLNILMTFVKKIAQNFVCNFPLADEKHKTAWRLKPFEIETRSRHGKCWNHTTCLSAHIMLETLKWQGKKGRNRQPMAFIPKCIKSR